MACFTDVWAALWVFGGVEVAEVLELVVFAHVIKNWNALPVGCFEIAVFGALFGDLNFAAYFAEFRVNFLLAFWADAFGFTQSSNHPTTASTMRARGSSIIDIVTIRSYLRISAMVEADVNRRAEA